MTRPLNVMLLAAGLGTRLKPLTLKYPKPCVPFLNLPLGLYQFQYLQQLDISKLIVNTHHLPKLVQKLYETQPYYTPKIFFSHEDQKILGGAGGLKKAASLLTPNQPILLMNADEVYFTQQKDFLVTALKRHFENKNLSTVVVIKHPEAGKKFGALWADQLQVKDISKTAEHKDLQPWHAIGPIFVSAEILDLIPENVESNIFYDVLLKRLSENKVEIFPIEADWYETGNPQDYFKATQDVLKNMGTPLLDFINQYDESVLIKNPHTTSLVSKKHAVQNSDLVGFNVISETTVQTPQGRIENSIYFENEILNENYFSSR